MRRLRQALALHEQTQAAVVFLDANDRIAFASPAARDLLERWFSETGTSLPEELRSRLRNQPTKGAYEPARIAVGDQIMIVHVIENALLLEEQRHLPGLTPREREILDLVAGGRTNAEIAAALWLAPGTVRRHLENVFRKLGVHTRTAAAALLRPCLTRNGEQ
jgi:DNA-binding CsgD family transcriptional regulator